MSDLVGNPEDRFSRVAALLEMIKVMLVASSVSEILFNVPDKPKSAEL